MHDQSTDEVLLITGQSRDSDYLWEIWKYRELLFFLIWRDILVRYKQTVIGILWALLRPLITIIIFTIVFSKVARLPSVQNVPYPLMVCVAMLPWQFFSNAVIESGNSLIGNANLISKVYFPRLLIPLSMLGVCLVDWMISCLILLGLMIFYGYLPDAKVIFVPLLALAMVLLAAGVGFWVSALSVEYRDFRFIVPFMIQLGLYISPIGFSSHVVPDQWRWIYSINPMVGLIDGFRWAILGGHELLNWQSMFVSFFIITSVFVTGVLFFRASEKKFADVI